MFEKYYIKLNNSQEHWTMGDNIGQSIEGKILDWYRLKKNERKEEYWRVYKKLKKLIFIGKNNFEKSLAAN